MPSGGPSAGPSGQYSYVPSSEPLVVPSLKPSYIPSQACNDAPSDAPSVADPRYKNNSGFNSDGDKAKNCTAWANAKTEQRRAKVGKPSGQRVISFCQGACNQVRCLNKNRQAKLRVQGGRKLNYKQIKNDASGKNFLLARYDSKFSDCCPKTC